VKNSVKALAAAFTAFAAMPAIADQPKPWGIDLQDPASNMMSSICGFENYTLWFIIPITLFVLGLLIYVGWRFSEKNNPVPSKTSHNTLIEVVWTVGPVVILLFLFLVHRAFAVGRQAASLERYFAALVAQGIGVWLSVQAFINMGVNMGLLPTKGLTLPLLSFGGTGIVVNCIALAILMRIDWENRYLMRGGHL